MFEASVRTHFSAAHHLVGYPGHCSVQHGHNWEVEATVRGRKLDKTGILVDFRDLKKVVRDVLSEVDHTDLNTLKAFRKENPTSENLARFLFKRLSRLFARRNCRVTCVTVRETPESMAKYWEE